MWGIVLPYFYQDFILGSAYLCCKFWGSTSGMTPEQWPWEGSGNCKGLYNVLDYRPGLLELRYALEFCLEREPGYTQ